MTDDDPGPQLTSAPAPVGTAADGVRALSGLTPVSTPPPRRRLRPGSRARRGAPGCGGARSPSEVVLPRRRGVSVARRRVVALGAAAGVLAASAVLWVGVGPPSAHPGGPVVTERGWTGQARMALASIDMQLREIDQTTRVWNSEIADQYRGMPTPEPVRAMLARRDQLQDDHDTLVAGLAQAERLARARTELAALDEQLAGLDRVLASIAASISATPGRQDSTVAGPEVGEQGGYGAVARARALLARDRAAKATQVQALAAAVARAQQMPLPLDGDPTAPITAAVRELDHRDRPTGPGTRGQLPPALAAGGPDGRRPAQSTTSGQSMPPRGEPVRTAPSRLDPDGPPSTGTGVPASPRPGAGPVPAVAGAAGRVLDDTAKTVDRVAGGTGRSGSGSGAVRHVESAAGEAIGSVGDAADRLLGGASGSGGASQDGSGGASGPAMAESAAPPSDGRGDAASSASLTSGPAGSASSGWDVQAARQALDAVAHSPAAAWVGPAIEMARELQSRSSGSSNGSSGGPSRAEWSAPRAGQSSSDSSGPASGSGSSDAGWHSRSSSSSSDGSSSGSWGGWPDDGGG